MAVKKAAAKGVSPAPANPQTGFGFLSVPKDLGGDLPLLEGTCTAALTKMYPGMSQANKPKLTLEFQILESMDGYEDELVIGSKVLENCSLQPQALWKLNDYFKAATGQDIPAGDYATQEEFMEVINALLETKWKLLLTIGTIVGGSGGERTEVKKANYLEEA